MFNPIIKYAKKWSNTIKRESNEMSPEGWGSVSFIAPLVAVPLAVKGAEMAYKEYKKYKEKKK